MFRNSSEVSDVMSNSRYDIVIVAIVVAQRSSLNVRCPKWVIRIAQYAEFTASFLHHAREENACQFYDSVWLLRRIFNPRGTVEPLWFLTSRDRGNALLTRKVGPKFVLVWTFPTFLFEITRCSCNCLFGVERNCSTICARRGNVITWLKNWLLHNKVFKKLSRKDIPFAMEFLI